MRMKDEHVEELVAFISIYLGAKGYPNREIICLLFGDGNDVISTVDNPATLKALEACADAYRNR